MDGHTRPLRSGVSPSGARASHSFAGEGPGIPENYLMEGLYPYHALAGRAGEQLNFGRDFRPLGEHGPSLFHNALTVGSYVAMALILIAAFRIGWASAMEPAPVEAPKLVFSYPLEKHL